MPESIETLENQGRTGVTEKLQEAQREAIKIGEEIKELKDAVSGIPDLGEPDLENLIKEGEEAGREEAIEDLENVKDTTLQEAKDSADEIRSAVNEKVETNTKAQETISSLSTKYGKEALAEASSAIGENSRKGLELVEALDAATQEVSSEIDDIKNDV